MSYFIFDLLSEDDKESSVEYWLCSVWFTMIVEQITYHWSQVLLTTTHYLQTLMFVEHWALPSKLNNSLIFELVTDSVLPLNYSVSWCKNEMINSATLGIIYPQPQTILTRNITSPSLLTLLTSPPPSLPLLKLKTATLTKSNQDKNGRYSPVRGELPSKLFVLNRFVTGVSPSTVSRNNSGQNNESQQ